MANPSGTKGTKGETAVVRWAREHGFGHADRLTKTGNHDRGDVLLCPGVMAEVKNVAGAAQRGPRPAELTEWMRQTEVERANGRHDVGILIVKRGGTTDVGRWWAYVTAWTLAEIVTASSVALAEREFLEAPVSLTVADLAALLRAAGWGDSLEDEVA
jgi:hypothetical protein